MVADYQGREYPCRLTPDVRGDIVPVCCDLASGLKRTFQPHEHDSLRIIPVP